MTRFVERLALVGSYTLLSVAVLTGAKSTGRSLTDARVEELSTRLDAMERRLASAEHGAWMPGAAGLTVKAPFVVTDANNVPIMTVRSNPRGMEITNTGKTVVVSAQSLADGGWLMVNDLNSSRIGILSAISGIAALNLRDGPDGDRVGLTIPRTGPAEIAVKNESHTPVVWIGHAAAGAGGGGLKLTDDSSNVLVAASALPGGGVVKTLNRDRSRQAVLGIDGHNAVVELRDGPKPRASMVIGSDGKPVLGLMNEAHLVVASLLQAVNGGMFQLSSSAGTALVEGGVLTSGLGIVRVGPRFKCTGNAGLGASDCIKGHP